MACDNCHALREEVCYIENMKVVFDEFKSCKSLNEIIVERLSIDPMWMGCVARFKVTWLACFERRYAFVWRWRGWLQWL